MTCSGSRQPKGSARRGAVVLILAIVCVAVASVMFLAILQTAVAERGAMDTRDALQQAAWLAESGLQRAAARLAADPAYQGETWKIAADELGGGAAAVVRIEVEPVPGDPRRRLVRVQADYPDAPVHRARRTKQATIQAGPSRVGDKP